MKKPFKKDRKLGVAENKGRYDLPLNNGAGASFMILLIGLMTFLALMALAGSFALGGLTDRWASGLENRATVEIPALSKDGTLRKSAEVEALRDDAAKFLKGSAAVKTTETLSDEDIKALVAPWLGESFASLDYPLPGLISVEFNKGVEQKQITALAQSLKDISTDIVLDTHDSWLGDILKLAGSLQISAGLITLIIALTTITAIAGAIRSRMAEHKDDVELLHLMGASDGYITRQFQKHALILALKGALAGLAAALIVFMFISIFTHASHAGMLPSLSLSWGHIFVLLLVPALTAFIAWMTARFTVLRVLSLMP